LAVNNIVEIARSYVGTPFQHQGRQKGVGIDCAGLVECVARDAGYQVPVHDNYGRLPYAGQLEKTLSRYLIKTSDLSPGCVILIKFKDSHPSHLAIFTGKNIIHSSSALGSCKEHIYNDKWKSMTSGIYKWPIL